MSIISPNEIRYSNLSLVDNVGRVFHWRNGIYRGIYASAAGQVRALFASGCLEELIQRGLFPETKITDHTLEGFAFVVAHKAVPVVTYPHEWSFEMFRDAAHTVVEICEIVALFGWRLKDCHPYNILFDGIRPLYVDLGSFVPVDPGGGFTLAADFLNNYWWPLLIWSSGNYFLAQRVISSAHDMMSEENWIQYCGSQVPGVGPQLMRHYRSFLEGRRAAEFASALERVIPNLAVRLPLEVFKYNPAMLRQKIANLRLPQSTTMWHNYHDEYFKDEQLISTPRFDRVVEIIKSLGGESAVEVGGNQGLLSLLLLAKTSLQRVICTDYDSVAIDRLYARCRKQSTVPAGKTLEIAVVNFIIPEMNFYTPHPAARFQSDFVIALALTHHLLLVQNFNLRDVLKTIVAYTRQFALVEFMPLGLWDGHQAPPIPDWYRPEWFREVFSEFFDVILVEEVETNRLLHVGRLKAGLKS